jgi:hypothetical protein
MSNVSLPWKNSLPRWSASLGLKARQVLRVRPVHKESREMKDLRALQAH